MSAPPWPTQLTRTFFVSVHINAAKNPKAYGIETFYLDNTTDRASLKLAAKENFVEEKVMTDEMSTTNKILADLITASKVEDSVPLAIGIQSSLVKSLSKKYKGINDKGVKKAPFWVLTGGHHAGCAGRGRLHIKQDRREKTQVF